LGYNSGRSSARASNESPIRRAYMIATSTYASTSAMLAYPDRTPLEPDLIVDTWRKSDVGKRVPRTRGDRPVGTCEDDCVAGQVGRVWRRPPAEREGHDRTRAQRVQNRADPVGHPVITRFSGILRRPDQLGRKRGNQGGRRDEIDSPAVHDPNRRGGHFSSPLGRGRRRQF